MKYEINGKVVETDRELSESEIDEIGQQIGETSVEASGNVPPSSGASGPSALDKLKGAASSVSNALNPAEMGMAKASLGEAANMAVNPLVSMFKQAPDTVGRVSNYIQGQPNQPAQTAIQAMANRPDVTATTAASLMPGVGLAASAARVGGTAAAAALNPENRGTSAATAGGLQALFEAVPYVGKVVAPGARKLLSKMSQTDADGLKKLFENPSLLFTGPNKEEARAAYTAATQKAGLTDEISDEIAFGVGKKYVKNVVDALRHSEDVPTQNLLDARQAVDDMINTAKRLGKKNKTAGLVQRRELIDRQIMAQEPGIKGADSTWSQMKTVEQFRNVLPRNRAGDVSFSVPAILAGVLSGGPAAVAASPLVQGLGASALGSAAKAGPATQSALQILRQYIQGQQRSPGSQ
jgi:hypothetical protein